MTKSKIYLWKMSAFCQILNLRRLSSKKREELGVVNKGFVVGALAKDQVFMENRHLQYVNISYKTNFSSKPKFDRIYLIIPDLVT